MSQDRMPDDFTLGPKGEQGLGWSTLYDLYEELPIPEKEGWKIGALYNRRCSQIVRLIAEKQELAEKLEARNQTLISMATVCSNLKTGNDKLRADNKALLDALKDLRIRYVGSSTATYAKHTTQPLILMRT